MKKTFYASIADNYDYIFPYNPAQVNFVQQFLKEEDCGGVLEVGCGTGNLSFGLASVFKRVEAIDLDREMLSIAREKNTYEHLNFHELNMLNLSDIENGEEFDGVVCFGNTMVHLKNLQQVELFVLQTKTLLKPGGSLFIQIINYDRILDKKVSALPTIDNDHIKFVRNYEYLEDIHKIDFKTKLTLKKSMEQIENSQLLFPIRKNELEFILKKYFSEVKYYGNFKGDELSVDSIPLIVVAK